MKIAVIDKCPSKSDYTKLFQLSELSDDIEVETLHMSSTKVPRLKVADIDLEVSFTDYDWVILIGSEATQRYSDVRSVQNYTGKCVSEKENQPKEVSSTQGYKKFLVSINPAMLRMKPEIKPIFDATIKNIHDTINDKLVAKKEVEYTPITEESKAIEYLTSVLNMDISDTPSIALDTETSGLYARKCFMLGLSMSHKEQQGVYIDADAIDEEVVRLVQKVIDSPRKIIFQNAKFDFHITKYHLQLDYTKAINEGRLHDTMVMHYALDERAGTHGLKALAIKYTDMGDYDRELDEFKRAYCKEHKIKLQDFSYSLIPFETMWPYACLSKNSRVTLEDGSKVEISKLVRNKYDGKVMSLNTETGKIEAKQVTNWVKNDNKAQEWKKIEYNYQPRGLQWSKGSLQGPAFTPDHRILANTGYVEIQNIKPGVHKVATASNSMSKDSKALLYGLLLGDGALVSRNNKGAGLQFDQSVKRKGFFDRVAFCFGGKESLIKRSNPKHSDILTLEVPYSHEQTDLYHTLVKLPDTNYKVSLSRNPDVSDYMDAHTLATWYICDGNLTKDNTPRIWRRSISEDLQEQEALLSWMKSLGVTARYHDDKVNNQFFVVDSANRSAFFNLIAPYMTEDTEYKIPKEYRVTQKADLLLGYSDDIYYAEVKSIWDWTVPVSLRGYKTSYCLDVEDNHNFLTDIGFVHNCGDTDSTLRLFNKFYKVLCNPQTHKVKWLYEKVLMPATVFLQKMENRGLPVSKKRLVTAKAFLYTELSRFQKEIYAYPEIEKLEEMQGAAFNPNSVVQLRRLFFDVLGLQPTGIMTDGGAHSTDKEVIDTLALEHPLPRSIGNYKKTLKVLNTFIGKLEQHIDLDGCVRTNFGCTTTTSGRLSSSGVINAQQLPRDNPIVKGCIVAPKGYKIIAKDLSTAEVYYAAVLSGDKNLQQVFLNIIKDPTEYADFHSTIAHMVFGLDCKPSEVKKLYPAMRQAAKAINVQ